MLAAFRNSKSGLYAVFTEEEAFRQELFLFVLFLPILYFLPLSGAFKGILFFTNTLILIVELLNSAIEAIVDLASPAYHNLAKQAKDMGSAAVMVSLVLAFILWGYAIFNCFLLS